MAVHLVVYLWMTASVMPRSISRRAVVSGLVVTSAPWPSHATATEVFTFEEQILGLDLKQVDGRVRIERIKPDSPALAKGVPPQSFIVGVNGQSTADLSIEAVTSHIRSASRPMELRLDASAFRALPAPRQTEAAASALGMASDTIQIELLTGPQDPNCRFRTRPSDFVEVEFSARVAESGREFDSSDRRSGRPFAFLLGNGDVVRGFEMGTLEMCIGEERLVRVPPRLGFGSRGSKAFLVPPDSVLEYRVRLVSINAQTDAKVSRAELADEQRFSEDADGTITNAGLFDEQQ